MTENSPTCILSSSCLQGPPCHRPLATISSGVDSPANSGGGGGAPPLGATTFCGGDGRLYQHHLQQPQQQPAAAPTILPSGSFQISGNGGGGGFPPNHANAAATGLLPTISASTPHPLQTNEIGELSCTELLQKAAKCSKMAGWKTSKFFSKSMTSGEILKGLKKLSLTSNSDEQDGKSLKSRFANLKKRSSYGSDETSIDAESSSSSPLNKSPLSGEMATSQKSLQDEGIVCKKEDLKAIICNATRRFPLCSPSRKRNALRQTKSASFEPPDDKKKEPVRRAGSEESRNRKSMPALVDRDVLPASQSSSKSDHNKVTSSSPVASTSQATKMEDKPIICKQTPSVVVTRAPQDNEKKPRDDKKTTCAVSTVSTVKWDESDVVDAVLIGDAIETFLKGSMTNSDKKVAFRKNSYEKKS